MRERFLKAIVNMAARRRKLVCITTLLLTIVTMGLSGMLKIDVRWSEMLPENLPVVQEFEKIDANYLQPGNMIVAVSG